MSLRVPRTVRVSAALRAGSALWLAAALLSAGAAAEAQGLFLPSAEQGPWLASDKELHFAGSLAIAASLRIEGETRATAIAGTFAIGLLKETYDATLKPRNAKRGASWKDLVADLAGALAGIAVLSAIGD